MRNEEEDFWGSSWRDSQKIGFAAFDSWSEAAIGVFDRVVVSDLMTIFFKNVSEGSSKSAGAKNSDFHEAIITYDAYVWGYYVWG